MGWDPFDGDGLEQLRAHDRAHARAAAGASFQAADDGIAVQVLAALADVQHADARSVFAVDPFIGGVGTLSPDGIGRQEFDLVVLDVDHGGPVGFPLDDHGVIAGLAQVLGNARAEVAVAVKAGQRRFGGDDAFPGVGRGDAGDGTQGDNQLVVRAERIGPGLDLVVEDFGGKTTSADPFVGKFLAERLLFIGLGGKIDPENIAGPTVHENISRN